ncbi:MAG: 8-amino-3,8-dideoxy-alpha-D-manno-octulosonate transaminase [Chloroflexota bacterium]|nr:MAG: 8-amino-3,8-dideoxy-alpha-D-manno-octulosonate transaminase [Chloroflexota bacterium]
MTQKLAIEGGSPACPKPPYPMYPGGNSIDAEEEAAVLETLRAKRLFRYYGPNPGESKAAQLEAEFAQRAGARYALGVTSGTAALICGLQGIGIGAGDEVIVPAYTWIASASAVLAVGGIPIVAEVDESLTLDPADIEAKISPQTKAIMPVHMRGAPANMDAILAVAKKHNLKVIEDTAQANGGSLNGKALGSFGDVGCFSLQFNKIITSGEGGMIITNNETVWKRAVMFHDVIGGLRNGFATDEMLWGANFRMPELLAAVSLVQLRKRDTLLDQMRQRKQTLKAGMTDIAQKKGIRFRAEHDPQGDTAIALVFYLDTAEKALRAANALQAENISAATLYQPDVTDYHIYVHWTPITAKRAWTSANAPWSSAQRDPDYSPAACPKTLDLLSRAVHLDVNPLMTNEDVENTLEGLNKVLNVLA